LGEPAGTACGRCGKPLGQRARGRRRLYCGDACRKGAQRDRGRPVGGDRRRAVQIATARAEAARAWRPLEAAARDTADLSAALVAAAAGNDRAALDKAIGELRAAVSDAARLAAGYFNATAAARSLEDSTALGATPAPDTHLRKRVFTCLRTP
jgi:hypothetical protein